MPKARSNHTPEEKVAILRAHLLDDVPVSNLCDEHGLYPTLFYRWQKQFFENGTAAFRTSPSRQDAADKQRIAALEAKLSRKHEVLSEVMEELVRLKKALGEP